MSCSRDIKLKLMRELSMQNWPDCKSSLSSRNNLGPSNFMMDSTKNADSRVPSCLVGRNSASPLQEPWSKIPRSSFLTRQPVPWTRRVRRSCSKLSTGLWRVAPQLLLHIAWVPFATVIVFLFSIREKLSSKAPMRAFLQILILIFTNSKPVWKCEHQNIF